MRNMEVEKAQLELLQKKWGNEIVKNDINKGRLCNPKKSKEKYYYDYNPIIKVPIKGV